MVYANALDPTTPTDLDPASQGDDEIRGLKAALIERLETLVEDIDEDPLEPRRSVFGRVTRAYINTNAASGGQISNYSPVEKTLILRIMGDTDESGVLEFDLEEFDGEYEMTYCVGVVGRPLAPDTEAADGGIEWSVGSSLLTLKTANESIHASTWTLVLFFSE